MLPETESGTVQPPENERGPLLHMVDYPRFVAAVGYAVRSFHPTVRFPDFSSLASVILTVYEHLGAPPEMQDPETLARLLALPWVAEHKAYLERLRE